MAARTRIKQNQDLEMAPGASIALSGGGQITGADIHATPGSIGTAELADDAVTADKVDETETFTGADFVTDNCASVDTLYTETKALANELKADLTDELSAMSLTIKDDDSAATNGEALYVFRAIGPFFSCNSYCSGGSADSYVTIGSDLVYVEDNGDDPEGAQVYLDEATGNLYCTLTGGGYIPTRFGRMLFVDYDANPSGQGYLALYFDDDGATASERVLFISGSDTDSAAPFSTTMEAFTTRPTIAAGDIA